LNVTNIYLYYLNYYQFKSYFVFLLHIILLLKGAQQTVLIIIIAF